MKISKGKKKQAVRVVIYGTEGIGKTTLAAHFPKPLFIDVEQGSYQIDVERFDGITTWADVLEAIGYVEQNPDSCKTLVLDTADKAEQMLVEQILKDNKAASIETVGGGYGKGYTMLQERFQKELLFSLDRIIAKGINVVICAHSIVRTITLPDADPYDHYELKCSKKVSPILKEWADILAFCDYKISVVTDGGKGKAKGSGKRMIHFTHKPTYDAKNRYGLPDDAEMSYDVLRPVIDGQMEVQPEKNAIDAENPHEGIVEGNELIEDIRTVLLRRLAQNGIDEKTFTDWLIRTGRIEEGTTASALSTTMAESMADHLDQLVKTIQG